MASSSDSNTQINRKRSGNSNSKKSTKKRRGEEMSDGAASFFRVFGGAAAPITDSQRLKTWLTMLNSGDEGQIFAALADLSPVLAMGTEDTLSNFDLRTFATVLITMLSAMAHNPNILLLSCRCICHILEALPASGRTLIRLHVLPALCNQLQAIQYMDVAEQCLIALYKLSHANSVSLLNGGALSAVLAFVDFFATDVQRTALKTAGNICYHVPPRSFQHVTSSIDNLVNLLQHHDPIVAESACVCLSRLVAQFSKDRERLEFLCANDRLVSQFVQMLHVTSESNQTSIASRSLALKTLSTLVEALPRLSKVLMDSGVDTLLQAAVTSVPITSIAGSPMMSTPTNTSSPASKSATDVYNILSLANALLPPLPKRLAASHFRARKSVPIRSFGLSGSEVMKDMSQLASKSSQAENESEDASTASMPVDMPVSNRFSVLRAESDDSSDDDQDDESENDVDDSADEDESANIVLAESTTTTTTTDATKTNTVMNEDDARLSLPVEDPERMNRLANTWLTTLADLCSSTVNSSVSLKVLEMATKLVFYTKDADANFTNECKAAVSNIVASVLVGKNPKNVKATLCLIDVVLDKLGDSMALRLRRDGVVHEVRRLAAMSDASTLSANTLKSPSSSVWHEISNRAKSLLTTRLETNSTLKNESSSELNSLATQLIETKDVASATPILRSIANLFVDENRLSTFEIVESRLVEALLHFLNHCPLAHGSPKEIKQNILERTILFGQVFAQANVGSTFVQRLHDVLLRNVDSLVVRRVHAAVGRRIARGAGLRGSTFDDQSVSQTTSRSVRDANLLLLQRTLRIELRSRQSNDPVAAHVANNMPTFGGFGASSNNNNDDQDAASGTLLARVMVEPLASVNAVSNFVTTRLAAANAQLAAKEEQEKQAAAKAPQRGSLRLSKKALAAREAAKQDASSTSSATGTAKNKSADDVASAKRRAVMEMLARARTEALARATAATTAADAATPTNTSATTTESTPSTSAATMFDASDIDDTPGVRVLEFDIEATDLEFDVADSETGEETQEETADKKVAIDLYHKGEKLELSTSSLQCLLASATSNGQLSEEQPGLIDVTDFWANVHVLEYVVREPLSPSDDAQTSDNIVKSKDVDDSTSFYLLDAAINAKEWHETPLIMSQIAQLLAFIRSLFDHETLLSKVGAMAQNAHEFENARLDALLSRQLHESLLLAARAMPAWCGSLAEAPARLTSLRTRLNYFRCTELGVGRALETSLAASQQQANVIESMQQQVRLARLERIKIRVRRSAVLACAMRALGACASSRAVLEAEFIGEVGTGLGPTAEFYTLVSKALTQQKLGLWRTCRNGSLFPLAYAPDQLPRQIECLFVFLGRLLARAVLDDRKLDIHLAEPMYAVLTGATMNREARLQTIDEELATTLHQLKTWKKDGKAKQIQALDLDFCMIGKNAWPLCEGGEALSVTIENVDRYVDLLLDALVGSGVSRQLEALRSGFESVLPGTLPLRCFSAREMHNVICGDDGLEEQWSTEALREVVNVGRGYTRDSPVVRHVIATLAAFTTPQRKSFVRFVTGTTGGAFPKKLKIVRKEVVQGLPDQYLPSVNTCFVYLKVPEYSSLQVTSEKLLYAMQHSREFTFN